MLGPRYVIYTPSYATTSGGTIVLHKLCHTLNELGEEAVVCAFAGPYWGGLRKRLKEWLIDQFSPPPFKTGDGLNTPVIGKRQVRDTDIVIYPELANGNPLRARNVVRWLLDRPSFRHRRVLPGKRDLFFIYDARCDEPAITGGNPATLFLFSVNKTYKRTNHGPRSGSCYLVRKGVGKPLVHNLEGSVMIDRLPHDEVNRIFNEREIFYSYDETSSYSQFAAICGCTSVVIPGHFKDQAEFVAAYPLSRYGVAYGEENIPHALATQHLVADYLKQCEDDGVQSVRDFVRRTREYFGFAPKD